MVKMEVLMEMIKSGTSWCSPSIERESQICTELGIQDNEHHILGAQQEQSLQVWSASSCCFRCQPASPLLYPKHYLSTSKWSPGQCYSIIESIRWSLYIYVIHALVTRHWRLNVRCFVTTRSVVHWSVSSRLKQILKKTNSWQHNLFEIKRLIQF